MGKTLEERLRENRLAKAAKFLVALTRLATRRGGVLPYEKIEKRLAICQKCEHFTGSKCHVCGCGVNGKRSLLNKLCYPLEQCPDDPPRWRKE